MTKVFQEFHLDIKAMKKEIDEIHPGKKPIEMLPPMSGKGLIDTLKDKGYTVLCGLTDYDGIPVSLLVSTELTSDTGLKDDFFGAAENLGLKWFTSGEGYTQSEN